MEHIYSIKDARIVFARELATSKGRLSNQACLLEGKEQIDWAISQGCPVEHVFIHDKIKDEYFFAYLQAQHIPCFLVSDGILKKITETSYLVPYVGVTSVRHLVAEPTQDFVVVLDNLQDHGNVGTIIRTASAFGIKDIVFTQDSSDAFFKKTVDASRGKVFEAHFKTYSSGIDAVHALQKKGYQVVATSPHAQNIQSLLTLKTCPVALIVGNETNGSSDDVLNAADVVVQIPMYSSVESLNVSIAASISIYELQIKLLMAMIKDKIQDRIGRDLSITLQMIKQAFDAELKKVSTISASQLILLMILVFDQTMTFDQITYDLGVSGRNLDDLLQPLLESGYVKCEVLNQEKVIAILPLGHEIIAKLWPVTQNVEDKMLKGFTDDDKKYFKKLLSQIQDNCSQLLAGK